MTSVCLLFSEKGETMQCAVWKDKHEQTETAVSDFGFQKKIYIYIFFCKLKIETETAVSGGPKCGFGRMKKIDNRTDSQISKPLHH